MNKQMAHSDLFTVRLGVDDSQLQRLLSRLEAKLGQHDEMILELQRLLNDKLSRREVDSLANDIRKSFDDRLNSFAELLGERVQAGLDRLERDVQKKLQSMDDMVEINARVAAVEGVAQSAKVRATELQDQVRSIAIAYGEVSGNVISFERDLHKQLSSSTTFITQHFRSISDTLSKLGHEVAHLREAGPQQKLDAKRFDISDLRPRPQFLASWRDPPDLPPIFKFQDIRDLVDHVYDLEPHLQGHLTAIHNRIVETVGALERCIDRPALDLMIEKLRRAIVDMDNEIGELRRSLTKSLTRADVMGMIAQAMTAAGTEAAETAVGAVRCMACGKEIRHVVGALAEADAMRRFGNPTNTLALQQSKGGGRVGELYSSPEQLQGIESPRAVRAFRGVKLSKQQIPKPK
jgi:hypothetical protein